jgi:hypothetical protein
VVDDEECETAERSVALQGAWPTDPTSAATEPNDTAASMGVADSADRRPADHQRSAGAALGAATARAAPAVAQGPCVTYLR